jgi:hypothetical protein
MEAAKSVTTTRMPKAWHWATNSRPMPPKPPVINTR